MSRHNGFTTMGILLGMLMLSANIPSPLYGVYAQSFHFGPVVLTAIFATYVACLVPSLLFFGQWSDHYGRRPALWGGLGLAMLGSVTFLFANGVAWLFTARALQGMAAGLLSGPATAMLTELDSTHRRAPLVASLATAGGTAVGPLVGGLLAQFAPWPLRLVYILALVGLFVTGIALTRVAETRSRPHTPFRWRHPQIPHQMRTTFWLAGGTAFVVWSVTAFFMSLAPSYVETLLHIRNLAVAGGVVFLMLAAASATQLITRGWAAVKTMPAGLAITSFAVCGLLLAVPRHSVTLLVASTILAGIGQGTAFLGAMTAITHSTPPAIKADVVSSFYVVIYVGVGAPILGLGLLAQDLGLYRAMGFYTLGIELLVAGLIIAFVGRRHQLGGTQQT